MPELQSTGGSNDSGMASLAAKIMTAGVKLAVDKRRERRQNALNRLMAQQHTNFNLSTMREANANNSLNAQVAQMNMMHINPVGMMGNMSKSSSSPVSAESMPFSNAPISDTIGDVGNSFFSFGMQKLQQAHEQELQSEKLAFELQQQKQQHIHDLTLQANQLNNNVLVESMKLDSNEMISQKDREIKALQINNDYDIALKNWSLQMDKFQYDKQLKSAELALNREMFEFSKTKQMSEIELLESNVLNLRTETQRREFENNYDTHVRPVLDAFTSSVKSKNSWLRELQTNEEFRTAFLQKCAEENISYQDLYTYISRNDLKGDTWSIIKEGVREVTSVTGEILGVVGQGVSVVRDVNSISNETQRTENDTQRTENDTERTLSTKSLYDSILDVNKEKLKSLSMQNKRLRKIEKSEKSTDLQKKKAKEQIKKNNAELERIINEDTSKSATPDEIDELMKKYGYK